MSPCRLTIGKHRRNCTPPATTIKLQRHGPAPWGLNRVKCEITKDESNSEAPPVPGGNEGRKRQSSAREPRCRQRAGTTGGLFLTAVSTLAALGGFKTLKEVWDPSFFLKFHFLVLTTRGRRDEMSLDEAVQPVRPHCSHLSGLSSASRWGETTAQASAINRCVCSRLFSGFYSTDRWLSRRSMLI